MEPAGNVFVDPEFNQKHLNRYYTPEGVEALKGRLKGLSELLLADPKYPVAYQMFGFPTLRIKSKEHHEGMIKNMLDILALESITLETNVENE